MMTLRTFALLFALLAVIPCRAQRLAPTFGVLTETEKSMTRYEKDPDAAAVILFDIGESYFYDSDNGYDIRFTRTKRVKIFSRAGFDHASVTIPFYIENAARKEKVVSIEANTYVLKDGLTYKKTLEPSAVFEEQLNNNVRVKKFTFPDVQEGCIVEYKYVVESPFLFNLPDWEFQSVIPTLYSEYTVSMIPFYEYIFIAQGITSFSYQQSSLSPQKRQWGTITEALGTTQNNGIRFNDMIHTYVLKDVPAFTDESYITSREDYIAKMDFQLAKLIRPGGGTQTFMTTWPDLIKSFLDYEKFGKFLNAAEKQGKKILDKELILAADMTEDKKCEAIMEYVHTNFGWDEYFGRYSNKTAKEFQQQKVGNAAALNLFLAGLLRAAGISADPVLISTRSHGKIGFDYPFEHYFNNVIVMVSGKRLFLMDASESLLAYDRIPKRCLNERGLIVTEGDARWISLDPRITSIEEKILMWTLDAENAKASIAGRISSSEYEAYDRREQFGADTSAVKGYLKEHHNLESSAVSILNADKPRLPYVVSFTGSAQLEQLDGKLIIQPLLRFPFQENPLRQQVRNYPVDIIYPQYDKIRSTVNIPAGYTVEALPEPISMDNDLAQINLKFIQSDKLVEVQADYVLKKSSYSPADYSKLRLYFGMIVRGFNASIVLVKN